jgi:hypothetical protein
MRQFLIINLCLQIEDRSILLVVFLWEMLRMLSKWMNFPCVTYLPLLLLPSVFCVTFLTLLDTNPS